MTLLSLFSFVSPQEEIINRFKHINKDSNKDSNKILYDSEDTDDIDDSIFGSNIDWLEELRKRSEGHDIDSSQQIRRHERIKIELDNTYTV